ncbi:hypothetical protein ABBQ38_008700 [Trebouxia sp. C0009 RCD-2024]
MAHQVLLGAQARLEQLQRQCDEAFTAYEANPNNEFKKKRYEELISSLHKAEDVMQSLATAAGAASWCKLVLQVPQVLGYLSPQLPSTFTLADGDRMQTTAKVFAHTSGYDSASKLHGRVMVFSGRLSDNSEAIAKVPASAALFEMEECEVQLRGVGHTDTFLGPALILQPVGCLIPYDIGHEALLTIISQFAGTVAQMAARGYLHGDLSYFNLLKRQDTDAALLVDMQTLMSLEKAAQCEFPTGTPLFMAWNVIRKQGHTVSTELESLMYVLMFILSGGILPWRHVLLQDCNLAAIRYGIMASSEFTKRLVSRTPAQCHKMLYRLRDLFFFTPGYSVAVTPDAFIAELCL